MRILAIGLWVCAVAFGSLYMSTHNPSPASAGIGAQTTGNGAFGGLDYVKTDVISVPIITNGSVAGYIVAQLIYTVDARLRKTLTVPLEYFINDEIFRQFYGSYSDTKQVEKVSFETIRQAVITSINERFPEPIIRELLVEQFNFISADEIRAMNMRRIAGERAAAKTAQSE